MLTVHNSNLTMENDFNESTSLINAGKGVSAPNDRNKDKNIFGTFRLHANNHGTFALETATQPTPRKDHTYAHAHALQKEAPARDPMDSFVCKETDPWPDKSNDHNYSFCSKTTPRGRQQFRKFYDLSEETRRSSSEENVSHTIVISPINERHYKNVPKINTRKCHSVEEMASDRADNISSQQNISPSELSKKTTPSRQRKNKQLKLCKDTLSSTSCHGPGKDHYYARELGKDHYYAKELEVISNNGIGNLKISSKAHNIYKGRKRGDSDSETVIPAQVRDHSYGKVSDLKTLSTRSTVTQDGFKLHCDHTYSGHGPGRFICHPNILSEPCKCGDAYAAVSEKNTSDRLQFQKDHTYSFKSIGSKIA